MNRETITLPRSVVEQALEALTATTSTHGKREWIEEARQQAAEVLQDALKQPQVEQEPVAWMFQHDETGRIMYVDAQQVEWGFEKGNPRWQKIYPVYLNPQPQRQPLTDEQINDHRLALAYDSEDLPDPWDFKQGVRAAERAHGIGGKV